MKRPSFIYFDLGKVLLTFCQERRCQQIANATGVDMETVANLFRNAGTRTSLLLQYERGELDRTSVYQAFCREALDRLKYPNF